MLFRSGSKPEKKLPEFAAYGVNANDEDPIAQALKSVLARLEQSEQTQKALAERLQSAGIDCADIAQATATQSRSDENKSDLS